MCANDALTLLGFTSTVNFNQSPSIEPRCCWWTVHWAQGAWGPREHYLPGRSLLGDWNLADLWKSTDIWRPKALTKSRVSTHPRCKAGANQNAKVPQFLLMESMWGGGRYQHKKIREQNTHTHNRLVSQNSFVGCNIHLPTGIFIKITC